MESLSFEEYFLREQIKHGFFKNIYFLLIIKREEYYRVSFQAIQSGL